MFKELVIVCPVIEILVPSLVLLKLNIPVSSAKVRRLYDIANVLTSLGLIKKVHVREERGRKPAFKWLGPVEFNNSAKAGKN